MTGERGADVGAVVSGLGFTVSLSTVNEIVQIIAGIVAIVAGCAAAYYHIKKARK